MADSKITALTSIGASTDPANDPLVLVDVSDTSMAASGTTKKVTLNQLLGASGTATLASATITGDLTVDTSTLKVDSANNRVGFGTASPAAGATTSTVGTTSVSASDYTASSTWSARFQAAANNQPSGIFLSGLTSGGNVVPGSLHVEPVAASSRSALIATYAADSAVGYFAINRFSPSAGTTTQHFKIADDGVATWSGVGGVAGTAMTLNSTGLGVGATPSYKFHVAGSANDLVSIYSLNTNNNASIATSNAIKLGFTSTVGTHFATFKITEDGANDNSGGLTIDLPYGGVESTKMTITSSGNVGVGVTPSAWNSSYKAIQTQGGSVVSGTTGHLRIYQNAFQNASNQQIYVTSAAATLYSQDAGQHIWFNAASGTAGNSFSFTQAMTLDASGNLLVGKTAISNSVVGFESRAAGAVFSTLTDSTDVGTTYHVYSTGATAYRFYVGLSGTVYATNTTISAISDARLKENVQDIDVGLGAILALKPRKFDWKAGKGKDIKGDRGFIAQEFEQVFPNLVDEWKDNAPEGEAPYKSVRQDLIPVLVKAIQELAARVEALEA